MGGAQIQSVTQVRLNELQVPQTTSEPGADRQAVLLHTDWNRERERETGHQRETQAVRERQVDTERERQVVRERERETETGRQVKRETGLLVTHIIMFSFTFD